MTGLAEVTLLTGLALLPELLAGLCVPLIELTGLAELLAGLAGLAELLGMPALGFVSRRAVRAALRILALPILAVLLLIAVCWSALIRRTLIRLSRLRVGLSVSLVGLTVLVARLRILLSRLAILRCRRLTTVRLLRGVLLVGGLLPELPVLGLPVLGLTELRLTELRLRARARSAWGRMKLAGVPRSAAGLPVLAEHRSGLRRVVRRSLRVLRAVSGLIPRRGLGLLPVLGILPGLVLRIVRLAHRLSRSASSRRGDTNALATVEMALPAHPTT